jgi:hypothetical protein
MSISGIGAWRIFGELPWFDREEFVRTPLVKLEELELSLEVFDLVFREDFREISLVKTRAFKGNSW